MELCVLGVCVCVCVRVGGWGVLIFVLGVCACVCCVCIVWGGLCGVHVLGVRGVCARRDSERHRESGTERE